MANDAPYLLPTWAPRLRKAQLTRLYESVGRGILDSELIDDVGFSLLARVQSMLAAQEAKQGRALCPQCRAKVSHCHRLLQCLQCPWQCPWSVYHKTIKYKHLGAGGMKPFFEEYVRQFPTAPSPSARLILIDTLIHRYHWESSSGEGRPGSGGLIEGKMSSVMAFLDRLNYGDQMPKAIEATREAWRQKWSRSSWKRRAEQMARRAKPAKPKTH